MKKIVKSLAILSVVAISLVMFSQAAMALELTGQSATANVVQGFTITPGSQTLNFGSFTNATTTGGYIQIAALNGEITTGGGVEWFGTDGKPGQFTVSGGETTARTVYINVTPPVALTTGSGDTDAKKLTVASFSKYPESDPLSLTHDVTFQVGGKLNVRQDQVSGTYTGTYTVSVTY